jgi:hypothetical protein
MSRCVSRRHRHPLVFLRLLNALVSDHHAPPNARINSPHTGSLYRFPIVGASIRHMERLSTLTEARLQELQVADLMRMLSAKAFCPADPAGYFSEHWPRSMHRDLVTKHFETMDYQ